MLEFHHIGIPSSVKRQGEVYLEGAKLFVTPVDASAYKVEWLRFEADSPMPELLKTSAHVAYKVKDIKAAMANKKVLIEPFSPMEGLTVAFIIDDGAPVELMQFAETKKGGSAWE